MHNIVVKPVGVQYSHLELVGVQCSVVKLGPRLEQEVCSQKMAQKKMVSLQLKRKKKMEILTTAEKKSDNQMHFDFKEDYFELI